MSAPIIAYRTKSLFVDSKEHLIAKLQVDYATMKSRFYLDEVLTVQIDENTNGVIGLVTIGGANESMHNITTRGGVGRIGNMRMLNDAGLNTYGRSLISETQVNINSGFIVIVSSGSSYYLDGVSVSVLWKRNADTSWIENILVTNQEKNTSKYYGLILLSESTPLKPLENINIKVRHTNSEGYKESSTSTMQVPMPSDNFSFDPDYGSFAYNRFISSTGVTSYYFDDFLVQVGTKVSLNSSGTLQSSAGYISNTISWYRIEIVGGESVIAAIGSVGMWDSGDPATPQRFIESTFAGWNSDWITGCTYPGLWTSTTIWFDNVDNVYRWTNSGSGSLVTGNFYTGNSHPNYGYEFVHIANGEMLPETFDCTHGIIITP